MQSWQINLSRTDSALLFLHTLGFVKGKNQLDFGELLDHYGRSATSSEIYYEGQNEVVGTFIFYDAYEVKIRAALSEKRPYAPADLTIDYRSLEKSGGALAIVRTEKHQSLPFRQWSRKYRCDEFGGIELCAEQVAQLVRVLSGMQESYREWHYYMNE